MQLIFKKGKIEIWQVAEHYGFDYYVYGTTNSGDPIIAPSADMAREMVAGYI